MGLRECFMSAHKAESFELELEQLFSGERPAALSSRPSAARGRRNPAERDLEGTLTSALLAGDRELDHVVSELESVSKVLKQESANKGERAALHPAVWYAVRQMLLERELRHLALSDDLTCLYNRRGFYAAATQQLKMARRQQKAAVLLFCDVDGLKAINDTYGHREGDLALVRAADALEEAFRDSDVLARLGGDEFAVLASDVTPEHHHSVLNRLHRAVRKMAKQEPRYDLSLSVGAAWFDPQNPVSLGELMEQADRVMYDQKRKLAAFPRREGSMFQRTNGGGRDAVVSVKRKI
jgi:diguanylate cyclase (GGDEF)-like protein